MAQRIFDIPSAPSGYNINGKKLLVHDPSAPESTSSVLFDVADFFAYSSGFDPTADQTISGNWEFTQDILFSGNINLANGGTQFNQDGSGQVASSNLSWNDVGDLFGNGWAFFNDGRVSFGSNLASGINNSNPSYTRIGDWNDNGHGSRLIVNDDAQRIEVNRQIGNAEDETWTINQNGTAYFVDSLGCGYDEAVNKSFLLNFTWRSNNGSVNYADNAGYADNARVAQVYSGDNEEIASQAWVIAQGYSTGGGSSYAPSFTDEGAGTISYNDGAGGNWKLRGDGRLELSTAIIYESGRGFFVGGEISWDDYGNISTGRNNRSGIRTQGVHTRIGDWNNYGSGSSIHIDDTFETINIKAANGIGDFVTNKWKIGSDGSASFSNDIINFSASGAAQFANGDLSIAANGTLSMPNARVNANGSAYFAQNYFTINADGDLAGTNWHISNNGASFHYGTNTQAAIRTDGTSIYLGDAYGHGYSTQISIDDTEQRIRLYGNTQFQTSMKSDILALTTMQNGDMLYCYDEHCPVFYNGTSWRKFSHTAL